MATNEDAYIEKDGKIIIMTEKRSTNASGMPTEVITIPELTEVNRAMVAGTFPSSGIFPVLVSGGCSGNAITIGWAQSGNAAPLTSISGDATLYVSGFNIQLVAGGH